MLGRIVKAWASTLMAMDTFKLPQDKRHWQFERICCLPTIDDNITYKFTEINYHFAAI